MRFLDVNSSISEFKGESLLLHQQLLYFLFSCCDYISLQVFGSSSFIHAQYPNVVPLHAVMTGVPVANPVPAGATPGVVPGKKPNIKQRTTSILSWFNPSFYTM